MQIPVQVPIIANQDNPQNANVGVGAVNTGDTTGANIDDRNDQGGDGIGNIQVAGAELGDVEGGDNRATTTVGGSAGNGTTISNSHSASNTATADGNIANNSSNNNTNTKHRTNSPNSVGNGNGNNNNGDDD